MSKYKLAICEKYSEALHGYLNIDKNKMFVTYLIDLDEFYNYDYEIIMSVIREGYLNLNMQNKIKNIRFELVDIYYVNDIMLCKCKTHLIKKIQRIWKDKFYKKQQFITKCKSIQFLKYREIHGKFPKKYKI